MRLRLLPGGGPVPLYRGAEMPAGFCPWAWIDLYRSVSALSCGASYTPGSGGRVNVVCCTDGLRPVTFLLEAQ
ncbi:MAG: TIGR04076 family protein [Eggerthella lenta]